MNFLKITVEVDTEKLAQRKRIITGNNSGNVKGRTLKRRFVQNKEIDEIEKQCDLYSIEDELRNLCDEYNNELKSSAYFEIFETKGKKLSMYSMIKENLSFNSLFNNLFHKLDLKSLNIEIEEVTFKVFEDRVNFHRKSELCESFGIDSLRCGNDIYIEKIIDCSNNDDFINEENNYIGRDNLYNELIRINSLPAKNKFYGHPVHYFINSDDYEDSQENCEILLKALYQKKRINSKRFCVVNFEEEIREDLIESLYKIGCGGVIIIDATNYQCTDFSLNDLSKMRSIKRSPHTAVQRINGVLFCTNWLYGMKHTLYKMIFTLKTVINVEIAVIISRTEAENQTETAVKLGSQIFCITGN